MTLFDATTWVGNWPFAFLAERNPPELARFLRRHRITCALVSPLAAVFAPEPGPANRALLEATRQVPALVPLPVLNPALANWEEELDRVAADPRVRAVRWLPAYHNYRLAGTRARACVRALQSRGLRLVLTVRLIDERHEYFALRIRPLARAALDDFLKRHAGLPVLLSGLSRPDLVALLPRHRHVFADVSFAEWDRTLERIRDEVGLEQVVFGSHTPFLITAANAVKVTTAALPPETLEAVARGNLERFLGPLKR